MGDDSSYEAGEFSSLIDFEMSFGVLDTRVIEFVSIVMSQLWVPAVGGQQPARRRPPRAFGVDPEVRSKIRGTPYSRRERIIESK